jgi:hypothetical protein
MRLFAFCRPWCLGDTSSSSLSMGSSRFSSSDTTKSSSTSHLLALGAPSPRPSNCCSSSESPNIVFGRLLAAFFAEAVRRPVLGCGSSQQGVTRPSTSASLSSTRVPPPSFGQSSDFCLVLETLGKRRGGSARLGSSSSSCGVWYLQHTSQSSMPLKTLQPLLTDISPTYSSPLYQGKPLSCNGRLTAFQYVPEYGLAATRQLQAQHISGQSGYTAMRTVAQCTLYCTQIAPLCDSPSMQWQAISLHAGRKVFMVAQTIFCRTVLVPKQEWTAEQVPTT